VRSSSARLLYLAKAQHDVLGIHSGRRCVTEPYPPPTSVDLRRLEQAAEMLEQIEKFVQTRCLAAMPPIHQALGAVTSVDTPEAEYRFTREATVFGGFYSAYGVQAAHDGVFRAVRDSLGVIKENLANVADSTRAIMKEYRAAEERGIAAGEEISRLLGEATPPHGSG
jgi:hypothetical protein